MLKTGLVHSVLRVDRLRISVMCTDFQESQLEKKIDSHRTNNNTDLSYIDKPKLNNRVTRSKATTD